MTTYNQFGFVDDDEFELEWEQDDEDQEPIKPGSFQLWQAKFIDAYDKLEAQKYKVGQMSPQIQTEWVALIDKGQQLKYNVNRINKFLGLKMLAGLGGLGIAPIVLIPAILGGGATIVMMSKFVSDATLNITRYMVNKDLTAKFIKAGNDPVTAAKKATAITNKRHPPSYGLFAGLGKKFILPLVIIVGIIFAPRIIKMIKG